MQMESSRTFSIDKSNQHVIQSVFKSSRDLSLPITVFHIVEWL